MTTAKIENLLQTLKIASFRVGKIPSVFAYVHQNDDFLPIYLCDLIFEESPFLEQDSQPGTLIHEVSHFKTSLGINDYQLST